jgi:hypothetical protein
MALHAIGWWILPPQPFRWLALILFEYAGHLARVAAQQPGALFDVTLAEILGFSKFAQPLSDRHE